MMEVFEAVDGKVVVVFLACNDALMCFSTMDDGFIMLVDNSTCGDYCTLDRHGA